MLRTTLLAFVAVLVLASAATAQVPQAFSYQAIARDNSGAVLPNSAVTLRMTITNTGSSAAIYVEEHSATTNEFGLFVLEIGRGTPSTGTFAGIDWAAAPKSVGVELNTGAGFVSLGSSALLSVPYALAAGSTVGALSLNDLDNVTVGAAQAGNALIFDGTNWIAGTPGTELSFPIMQTVDTDQLTPALELRQAGAGSLLRLTSTDQVSVNPTAEIISSSQAPALIVRNTNRLASAGYFETSDRASSSPALQVTTLGVGNAGSFTINNTSSDSAALRATTNGTGAAVYGVANANGRAWGVYGEALGECIPDRTGLRVTCPAGVFGDALRGPGVFGRNRDSGVGVQGYSETGRAFEGRGPTAQPGFSQMVSYVDHEGNGYNRGDLRTPATVASSRNAMATRYTPGDTGIAAGDVVVVNPGGAFLESDGTGAQATVVGVAVDDAAYTTGTTYDNAGMPSGTTGTGLFAFAGIVTINVDDAGGTIAPGDLLVASSGNRGHARNGGTTPATGTIIAKALGNFAASGTGSIRALVMVR